MQTESVLARHRIAAFAIRSDGTSRQRIDTRDPAEISRLSRELGVTWLQLFRIIDRVGADLRTVRSAVMDQLGVTWH